MTKFYLQSSTPDGKLHYQALGGRQQTADFAMTLIAADGKVLIETSAEDQEIKLADKSFLGLAQLSSGCDFTVANRHYRIVQQGQVYCEQGDLARQTRQQRSEGLLAQLLPVEAESANAGTATEGSTMAAPLRLRFNHNRLLPAACGLVVGIACGFVLGQTVPSIAGDTHMVAQAAGSVLTEPPATAKPSGPKISQLSATKPPQQIAPNHPAQAIDASLAPSETVAGNLAQADHQTTSDKAIIKPLTASQPQGKSAGDPAVVKPLTASNPQGGAAMPTAKKKRPHPADTTLDSHCAASPKAAPCTLRTTCQQAVATKKGHQPEATPRLAHATLGTCLIASAKWQSRYQEFAGLRQTLQQEARRRAQELIAKTKQGSGKARRLSHEILQAWQPFLAPTQQQQVKEIDAQNEQRLAQALIVKAYDPNLTLTQLQKLQQEVPRKSKLSRQIKHELSKRNL